MEKTNKIILAKNLRNAFRQGAMKEITEAVTQILEAGYFWVAVYSDGFWADNPGWICNAREFNGLIPVEIRVDTRANLYA